MFEQMIASIQEDTVKLLFTLQVKREAMPEREQVAKPTSESGPSDGSLANQPRAAKKPGRNDPCPCGSGKKYKKCCGQNESSHQIEQKRPDQAAFLPFCFLRG